MKGTIYKQYIQYIYISNDVENQISVLYLYRIFAIYEKIHQTRNIPDKPLLD